MESLNDDYLKFSAKIIKSFVLSSQLGIRLQLEIFQRISPNLPNFQGSLSAEVEIKLFCISRGHMVNESHNSVGQIHPYPIVRAAEQNSIRRIYMYYKLRQACVTNWGSFFITNQEQLHYYQLGQVLLQFRATIIRKQHSYYGLGQNVLQIWAAITNQSNYFKLRHNRCAMLSLRIRFLQKVDLSYF